MIVCKIPRFAAHWQVPVTQSRFQNLSHSFIQFAKNHEIVILSNITAKSAVRSGSNGTQQAS